MFEVDVKNVTEEEGRGGGEGRRGPARFWVLNHGYLIGYVLHSYRYRMCIRYDGSNYSNSNLSPGPRARWSQHPVSHYTARQCVVVCSV